MVRFCSHFVSVSSSVYNNLIKRLVFMMFSAGRSSCLMIRDLLTIAMSWSLKAWEAFHDLMKQANEWAHPTMSKLLPRGRPFVKAIPWAAQGSACGSTHVGAVSLCKARQMDAKQLIFADALSMHMQIQRNLQFDVASWRAMGSNKSKGIMRINPSRMWFASADSRMRPRQSKGSEADKWMACCSVMYELIWPTCIMI